MSMTKNVPPGAWPAMADQIQLEGVKIASSGLRGNDFTQFNGSSNGSVSTNRAPTNVKLSCDNPETDRTGDQEYPT